MRESNSMPRLSSIFYDPLLQRALRTLRRAVTAVLPADKNVRIIDLCCGTGDQLSHILKAGYRQLYGLDLSADMIGIASRKSALLQLYLGDATEVPFPDASFDVVLISLALHDKSNEQRHQILAEIRRLLKPSAFALAADFCFDSESSAFGRIPIRIVEAFAGGEHYRNFRDYIRRGGLPGLIPKPLFICREAGRAVNNSIAVWRLNPREDRQ